MQQRTLDSLLEALRGRSIVVHAAPPTPPVLATFPTATASSAADVAIGVADAASLEATVQAVARAVRAGGTVLVVAKAPGLFGLGASRAPELTAVCEALLKEGIVELAVAMTPGTLKKELLVWGVALGE